MTDIVATNTAALSLLLVISISANSWLPLLFSVLRRRLGKDTTDVQIEQICKKQLVKSEGCRVFKQAHESVCLRPLAAVKGAWRSTLLQGGL